MMDNEDSKNQHIGEGPQTMETETVENEQGEKTDNKRNKHDINDMTGNDLENEDGRTLLGKADTMTNGKSEDQQSREEPETKPFENEQRRETSSKRTKRKNTKKKRNLKSSKPDLNNDLTGKDLENNEGKTLPWKAEAMANGESTDQWGEGVDTMETEKVGNEQGKKTGSKRKMRGNLRKKQKSKSSKADLNNGLTANDLEKNEGRTLPWEAGTMIKGPQTKTVENQQGKKTGSKRNTRKNRKEKRKSKSPQVPDIDEMLENDFENDEGRTLPWKERSFCHFTWNLKVAVTTDYERIIRNMDNDLEEAPNLLRMESLLFRAYLEVCDDRKHWDVTRAREFLDRADECIEQTDARLRKGYRVVALLDRMWIEYRCQNTQKVADLLSELDSLRLRHKDHSVIGAVRAAALTRLGPRVMETALQLFEVALQSFPKNVDFIYGAGLMTGRMARYRRADSSLYAFLDKEGRRLMNSEKEYWEKMMTIKDEYQLARSSLGLNISRRQWKKREKGYQHLREAYKHAPHVQEVVRNWARYYKDRHEFEEAISILEEGIKHSPHCPESHFQLALCYIECSTRDKKIQEKKDNWNKKALKELHKCLEYNKGHNFALTKLCNVNSALGNHEEAEKIFETRLQQSEHRTTEDKLDLYFGYANYLDYTPTASKYESRMDMWRTVMDVAASFGYLDEASGTWQVSKKAKKPKEVAYKRLLEYYNTQTNPCLEVGILHFQNFKFKEAVEKLIKLIDTEADLKIPWYLAQTYLKLGREEELQIPSQNLRSEKANETFRKAREYALCAMKAGLNQMESRKLLADIALAIAHNELRLVNLQGQMNQPTSTLSRTQSMDTLVVDNGAQQISSKFILSRTQSQDTMEVGQGPQQMPSTSTLPGTQDQDTFEVDQVAQQMPSSVLVTQSHNTTTIDEGAGQMKSTSTLPRTKSQDTIEVGQEAHGMAYTSTMSGTQGHDTMTDDQSALESRCIQSYREAVRCGSLVASLELLRLIQKKDGLQVTSRWIFLQILAEIDVSCSLRGTDLLHQEEKPLSFGEGLSSRDRDKDASALNCKTIKRGIVAILHQEPFFRQAWREHFNMEREILRHRFENNEGELELDGREEEKQERFSDEIVYAATDCCEKLRPLLDRIFVRFGKEELGIEEIKGQYFPLILDEEIATKTQDKLRGKLMEMFGIDMEKNYPKLYQQLLKTQPGCSSQNGFLKTFCTMVNKIKHSDVHLNDILETSKDPVTLARQCTDKVEEICNFFFDTIREARDLRRKVTQLEDDIRHGEHEKAGELLEVLSSNESFVFRIGSTCTWKLLEKIALIRHNRRLSSSRDLEADELESKLTDGACALYTQTLRRCHQAVEDALFGTNPTEVRTKCRDTCGEAVKLLNSILVKHQKKPHGCQSATQQPVPAVTFPFCDLHPGVDRVDQWKGKVKKHLNKELNKMEIPGSVQNNKELLETVMQAQPCTDEENYQFIAMEVFLKQCDGGGAIPDTVSIQPINQEEKTFQVLELTRWITDNSERIAIKIEAVKVAGQ